MVSSVDTQVNYRRFGSPSGVPGYTGQLPTKSVPQTAYILVHRAARGGYTRAMTIDRILISLGILLLVVGGVLAAVAWL
ncbi:MAG: hypothetical protein M3R38_22710 [Actinomycetota bacterium]|nr:hypothetical protein [Actinomycetota bacterium]